MPTLKAQLLNLLPDVLPADPNEAINGTQLLRRVGERLDGEYAEASIRQHFSLLSGDPTSPIAKVEQGHGYYLRAPAQEEDAAPPETSALPEAEGPSPAAEGRSAQREEKFRALFMRHAQLTNSFPMKVEHTAGARRAAGINRWKFPDVIVLDWDVGEATDDGFRLDRDLLEVKRSLGEQPFRLTSVELKVELNLSSFREAFFQCLSNSKWAHSAVLAVAGSVTDKTLAEELRRLGSSYEISVLTYGLSGEGLDGLPSANEIAGMSEADFETIASGISQVRLATGRLRDALDWEHVGDMRAQSTDFQRLFEWISYCLGEARPYPYQEFERLRQIRGQFD